MYKKGQILFFIVLGVVITIALFFMFILSPNKLTFNEEDNNLEQEYAYSRCVEESANDAVQKLKTTGGSILYNGLGDGTVSGITETDLFTEENMPKDSNR